MASPQLSGVNALTHDGINNAVKQISPRVYALGETINNTFYISRVGRSDGDLNKRLHDYVGQYKQFKASYMPTAQAAFLAECELWHDFRGAANPIHPARPAGTTWQCPRGRCL